MEEYNTITKTLELAIFIRILKFQTLLYEVKQMRVIIETLRNLIKPLIYLGGVLITIFYLFALFGMAVFGGKIVKDSVEKM